MKFVIAKSIVAVALLIVTSTAANAWAYQDPGTCEAVPGPGYCSCYWYTDDVGKKVPNSDVCDSNLDGLGGCVANKDCNHSAAYVSGPSSWPYGNIGAFVNLNFWVF